ncbi:DUF3857 domain-containing transglutaminase family protein [Azospirillum himalayense]|uniref:DUF3857 domain-containing transglutaminase family protein n=1 Tax=Azospirillum himalayense TaxID=654847 RepID=A0ABW0GGH2_9PROT
MNATPGTILVRFRKHLVHLAAASTVVLLSSIAAAQAGPAPFARKLTAKMTVEPSGLLSTVVTEEITLRSDAVLQSMTQIPLPVNEHFSHLDIIEAATVKPDGRHIPVPASKILKAALPNAPQLGIFHADLKIHTLVFPDVAVGDTLRYTVRLRDRARPVPGGFSAVYPVLPAARYEQMVIAIDAPKEMTLHEEATGFSRIAEEHGDRRLVTWTLVPQADLADEPNATAPIDRISRLVIGSYRDWDAIGQRFYEDAASKSEPTAEIRALADEITRGITDRQEQARAIYDWVSKNVRYFAVLLGQGGYVPHDAGTVLANKFGDCKDHTVLTRALLAAKGIEADFALISVFPSHREPTVPAPEWFNHVILWLPEFNRYIDPTAGHAAFGIVHRAIADKAVLRAGRNGVALTRTPAMPADDNRLSLAADVVFAADGTMRGTTLTQASGAAAMDLRAVMEQAAAKGGDVYARDVMMRQRWRGTASIDLRDPFDREEPYAVNSQFSLTGNIFTDPESNGVLPFGLRLVQPAYARIYGAIRDKRTQDFICESETFEQTINFHLPEGLKLTNLPEPVAANHPLTSYTARYTMNGQTLHVERRLVTRLPGQACPASMASELAPVIGVAMKDFNWRPQFSNPALTARP